MTWQPEPDYGPGIELTSRDELEDEDEEAAAMDYDSLMAYFESLKESTA